MWLACLMLSLTSGCATNASLCGALSKFRPDPGYETRLTRNEKIQIVQWNAKLDEFCR